MLGDSGEEPGGRATALQKTLNAVALPANLEFKVQGGR